MSKRKPMPPAGGLPLPSPRSPRELDDRILARARELAPARTSLLRHPWTAGVATAGVVGVALFISLGQPPTPILSEGVPASEPEERQELTRGDTGIQVGADQAAGITAPATAARTKISPMAAKSTAMSGVELSAQEAAAEFLADSDTDFALAEELPLPDHLRQLADMLAAGQVERAHSAYRKLREECGDCALPESLEEALSLLLPLDKP